MRWEILNNLYAGGNHPYEKIPVFVLIDKEVCERHKYPSISIAF